MEFKNIAGRIWNRPLNRDDAKHYAILLLLFGTLICGMILLAHGQSNATVTTINYTQEIQSCESDFGIFIFLCPFNIVPYFAYILLVVPFGIGYVRSHKLSIGFLGAAILSFGILGLESAIGISVTILPVAISVTLAILFVVMSWIEIHKK